MADLPKEKQIRQAAEKQHCLARGWCITPGKVESWEDMNIGCQLSCCTAESATGNYDTLRKEKADSSWLSSLPLVFPVQGIVHGAREMHSCPAESASVMLEGATNSIPANRETVPSGSPLGGLSSWGSESESLHSVPCWHKPAGRTSSWPHDKDSCICPSRRHVSLPRALGSWEACGARLIGLRTVSPVKGVASVSKSSVRLNVVLMGIQGLATGDEVLEVGWLLQSASNCRKIC